MRITYSYLQQDFSQIKLKAAFEFALNIAKEKSKKLTIAVNVISSCSQFMGEIFEQPELNKLKTNQSIQRKGVSIKLESTSTIKAYETYTVIFALHPSESLLEKIDNNQSVQKLLVLAESNDVSAEWLTNAKAQELFGHSEQA